MKRKSKIVLGIILVTLIFVIMIAILWLKGIIKAPDFIENMLEGETDLERIERVMKTTRPTDIFILGEEIKFEMDIDNTVIDELTNESIESDKDFVVVVINDLDDKVELSEEEIKVAGEFIREDGNLLIYLGEKYSTTWDKMGEMQIQLKGNLCYEYFILDGFDRSSIGGWSEGDQELLEEYPDMLGDSIMYSIDSYWKELD